MEGFVSLGHAIALVLVGYAVLRHRWNAAHSYLFVVNALFLALYYWPVLIFGGPIDQESATTILLGHLGMNLGLSAGTLLSALLPRFVPPRTSHGALHVPSMSFLLVGFVIGLGGYAFLYTTRGVPLLADNIDVARANLVAGMGFITWPSTLLIDLTVWVAIIRRRYWLALILGAVGGAWMLLSGWRGQLMIALLTTMFILAYRRVFNARAAAVGALGLLIIGVIGAIRPVLSGQEGFNNRERAYDFDPTSSLRSAALEGSLQIAGRFAEENYNFQTALDLFAAKKLHGRGMLMDLGVLIPGRPHLTIENYMREQFGWWEGGGGMPPTILGGFYADFGKAGVLILSALVAAFQVACTAILRRAADGNPVYLLPLGIMAASWVNGMVGTYVLQFVVTLLVYGGGTLIIVLFYSSDFARVLQLRRESDAETQSA